jgi:hypothetical protein
VTTFQNYLIRLVDGKPVLFAANGGPQITDHRFGVPAGACYAFTFKIPFEGAEEKLRFKRLGDPAPDQAITWEAGTSPPASIQPSGPTHSDKEIVITVSNPTGRKKELQTSFTLNLIDLGSNASINLREAFLGLDPTIIEKPDEPPD